MSMTLRSITVPLVRIRTRIGQADWGAEAAIRAAAAPTATLSSVPTRPPPAGSAASREGSMPTGGGAQSLSLIHISEPTRLALI
eukprot:2980103-Alexandrium_andersonii.AAC.1